MVFFYFEKYITCNSVAQESLIFWWRNIISLVVVWMFCIVYYM